MKIRYFFITLFIILISINIYAQEYTCVYGDESIIDNTIKYLSHSDYKIYTIVDSNWNESILDKFKGQSKIGILVIMYNEDVNLINTITEQYNNRKLKENNIYIWTLDMYSN